MAGGRSGFAVTTEQLGGATVVSVSGEVDLGTAPEFEDELTRAVEEHLGAGVVVDLRATTFIDSTGLNALVHAFERQRLAGSALALVSADSRVAMMLEVTRLDRVLRRYPTLDGALAAVASG